MIESYRKLWPQRVAVQQITTQQELEKYVLIELNDELTHPRVRKTKQQKLALALERIEQSDLSDSEKSELITLYNKLANP
ncbi:hypothetical protein ACQKDD_12080 [Planococcus kocurii]|uniref:Uncharacterized protein n=1 Tax=Planococcus kocurii TaxID=1374 RepID=A0ABN4JYF1_9BACL|nr:MULTISPECIES: hypothetical protein [Planococcus]ALS78583.1 hypothetical protein AUO94_07870 [Planococcus kocurii]KAA0956458.1 hypothetical protein FQ085_13220 [Planococcus sp. ANT_H30]